MPYYIYRLKPLFPQPEKVAEHASFKLASIEAKQLRAAIDPAEPALIKVIFADNELHAEDLLSQVREPGPAGDD